jgi:hypothetical protein
MTGLLKSGLTLERLDWLCQPDHLEETLRLLSYLNQWAKARDKLLYEDRQGLYEVKATLLEAAYQTGQVQLVGYIDGTVGAFDKLMPDHAASSAAAIFTDDLTYIDLKSPSELEMRVIRLYHAMTGTTLTALLDRPAATALEKQAARYILDRLHQLMDKAKATRIPISPDDLKALLVYPFDLIENDRSYDWDDVDANSLRQLDPEDLSLVALQYMSVNAWYTFHLPYRIAETFVPSALLETLRQTPVQSREAGEFFGRAITEIDSLLHPIDELMELLGVFVPAVCPYGLIDKDRYIQQKQERLTYYFTDEWDDDWDDDDDDEVWEDLLPPYARRHTRKPAPFKPTSPLCCRLCATEIEQAGLPRLQHWQESHADVTDLTVSQVGWVIGESNKNRVESILPHSYRLAEGNTRYWTLDAIRDALNK